MTEICPQRLSQFLGHGNPSAECWFVGMEEGAHTDMSLNGRTTVILAPFFGNGAFGTADARTLIEHLREP